VHSRGPGTERREVSLADYQDRWLVLIFYPRDFSMVCPTELTAISLQAEEFHKRECDLLGVSTDGIETHERWLDTPREQGGLAGLNFPLASDPDGSVCRAYNVYVPRQNCALRGLFIIDPNGVLQYQVVHNLSVGRGAGEILRVLDALQSGGLCPSEWSASQAPMDLSRTLVPNHVVGHYRIESVLGRGSFGTVYRAHDLTLDRSVALKVLRPGGETDVSRALSEARAAASLTHPNICVVYSIDSSLGNPIIVMEYVDGEPLSRLLEGGPLGWPTVVDLGRQLALGMAAAHAQGVVHGDLKPANVMVGTDGAAKLMDFGLARRYAPVEAGETIDFRPVEAGALSGTPNYMAPEQTRGLAALPASDVFALGLIIHEMVTGRPVFQGRDLFQVLRTVEQVNPDRIAAQVPEPLAGILRESLIADHSKRTISMADIGRLLTVQEW
jgi:alkyl hydroperoxide reductase subunit AhpC